MTPRRRRTPALFGLWLLVSACGSAAPTPTAEPSPTTTESTAPGTPAHAEESSPAPTREIADESLPIVHVLVLGGNNLSFEAQSGVEGAVPTETVSRIFEAHTAEERYAWPRTPPGVDARLTASMCGVLLDGLARVTLSGAQGLDMLAGPQTIALTEDLARDGFILTVPDLSSPEALQAWQDAVALVERRNARGLLQSPHRVLLAFGSSERAALEESAARLDAELVIAHDDEALRTALRELVERSVSRAAN